MLFIIIISLVSFFFVCGIIDFYLRREWVSQVAVVLLLQGIS